MELLPDWETIRTSPMYEHIVIMSALRNGGVVLGVGADKAPQTFEELQGIVEAFRNPDCSLSDDIENFVAMLADARDRDELTRQLPFYDGDLVLAVPAPDAFTDEAWEEYFSSRSDRN